MSDCLPWDQWPQWLKDADTRDAKITMCSCGCGQIEWHDGVWHDGEWHGGVWHDGEWRDGEWCGGVWCGGVWRDGVWCGGVWCGGVWHDGEWRDGVWRDGEWRDGVWRDGEWCDPTIDRLIYMAAMCGIVFDERGLAVGWRSTLAGGKGRHTTGFVQPSGEWYDPIAAPAGKGTCVRGIHVTTQARALTYFGIVPTAELWRVEFKRADLLDCDGEKARIRGGVFTRVPWPFYRPEPEEEG